MSQGDIAVLGIRVESGEAVSAADDLDKLTKAGERAEVATGSVGAQAKSSGVSIKDLAASTQSTEQAMDRYARQAQAAGMSTKAYAAALRTVPAQLSDIVVGLQGGQSIMTVALQQGSQLRDQFGGVGSAARALGGHLLSLVNPYSVLAAAVAGAGLAYYKGQQEAEEFRKALILTGNAAGTNSGALTDLSRQISTTVGTTGAAAEVLAQLAGSGKIAGDSFSTVATAALQMKDATGRAIEETIAEFVRIGKDPVAAARELEEQYGFLTASTYAQIAAMKDQGDTVGAAKLLTDEYARTIDTRSKEIVENLGWIEKAWRGVWGMTKNAGDAALNFGRTQGIAQQLAAAQADLADLEKRAGENKIVAASAQAKAERELLQSRITALIGAQRGEMQKLGEAGQALVRWEQQLADIKDKKTLTADQKSLLANQDLITAQLKRNAGLEREMQLRKVATEEAQKLAAFEANLNSQLQRASVGLDNNLAGMGLGDQAQQRLQERFSIEQQYQQQMDNLLQQRNEGRISESLYQKENAALQSALDQRLAKQEQYYQRVDELQSDWSVGARAAFGTYLEQARNVAGQTRTLFTNAFSNMEDSIVTFVKTGKLSFKDFADGVIEDLIRIQVRQAAVGFLGTAFGFLGGGSQALGQGTMTGFSEPLKQLSTGGYTGDGGKFEPKGVVHGGEFVLRKEVVAQPGMRNYLEGLNVRGYASGGFVTPRIASTATQLAASQPEASISSAPGIVQHISVQGTADDATLARIQQAAQKGAQDGYNLVLRDLKMNGPARQLIARNR